MVIETIPIAKPSITMQQHRAAYSATPFSEAHVTIIEGAQRSGKSTTGFARIRDGYDRDCVRIFCENVLKMKCEVKSYDRRQRIARIKHDGALKALRIPDSYKLYSPRRIFSNVHFFGIPYTYVPSFQQLMQWLKDDVIVDAWVYVDESYVGMGARGCMKELGKALADQYWQFGKMRLDVIIITPMARLIDWELRTIPTEHIYCDYNSKTCRITLIIRKKGIEGERNFPYDPRPYWPGFDTTERVTQ